jgi:hypothetical protein
MAGALKTLGVGLEEDWPGRRMTVQGCGGRFPVEGADLFLGNAGTAMRWVADFSPVGGRGKVSCSRYIREISLDKASCSWCHACDVFCMPGAHGIPYM